MHKLFLDFKRGIMELKQYIIESSRTCPDLGLDFNNQMHMAIGISTEAGELLDAYKKKLAYNKSLDKTNVAEEIGDLCWYVANLCRILNLDLQEILQNNIDKLRARYPEKFTEEKANNRNLEEERKILEKLGFE